MSANPDAKPPSLRSQNTRSPGTIPSASERDLTTCWHLPSCAASPRFDVHTHLVTLARATSCPTRWVPPNLSLFWVHAEGAGAMGEVHSHQFRPVKETWLRGEENEMCCECGERLWIIFEDSDSPRRGLSGRFRERFDRFSRLSTT